MQKNNQHNFVEMNRCSKCGITLEEHENRGETPCIGFSAKSVKFGTGNKSGGEEKQHVKDDVKVKSKPSRYI